MKPILGQNASIFKFQDYQNYHLAFNLYNMAMKTSTMPVLMMIIMSYYGIDNDDGEPSNILREEEKQRQLLHKPERLCRIMAMMSMMSMLSMMSMMAMSAKDSNDGNDGGPSNILREEEKRRQWLHKPEKSCQRRRPSSKLRGKSPNRSYFEIMRSCFEKKSKNIG